ncbi:MAG: PQQ-binding-like beta-propeller repeat protein [Candidatus Hinthialibacter antarcticus]|nr:PQQ-binding-like beta-propeller repeat protein [Candidatus Hinthialibacter antarcticus]
MLRNLLIISLCVLTTTAWADWPQFRGPNQDGIVPTPEGKDKIGLPTTWSETENVVWKTPIHDHGWSSPVILGNQIWLTSATEDGKNMYVFCIDKESGKVLFDKLLFTVDSPRPLGNDVNTYASCTAAIEGGRVYVHFGSYGTAAIDTKSFETLWEQRDLPCNHYRGPASSVVIYNDLIILTFDGADLQYQAALNKNTGKIVWKTDRTTKFLDIDIDGNPKREGDFRKAFSTPLVREINGSPQMWISASYGSFSYDPRNGKELWKIDHGSYSNASMAMFGHGLVYLITGRGNADLMGVKPDGEVVWRYDKAIPSMVSPLLIGEQIYMINNGGVATCVNALNGEEVWRERLGGEFYASPIYGDGVIYSFATDGTAKLYKPGEALSVFAENKLDNGFMATPAVDGKALYLRTTKDLYRIEKQ